MEREEFYNQIGIRKKEIESMNISEEQKSKLYSLVDETTKRYEELKINQLNNQITLEELRRTERKLERTMQDLLLSVKTTQFDLECTLRELQRG